IARVKRGGYVTLALALGCGMTLTHHMVPPTPGPLAATGILGADLGGVILARLVFTAILLPVVIVYARWIGPKLVPALYAPVSHRLYTCSISSQKEVGSTPGLSGGSGSGDDSTSSSTADESDRSEATPATASTKSPGAFLGFLPLIVPLLLIV